MRSLANHDLINIRVYWFINKNLRILDENENRSFLTKLLEYMSSNSSYIPMWDWELAHNFFMMEKYGGILVHIVNL